jgi:E3 ubiquitin-protein ligase DOA10
MASWLFCAMAMVSALCPVIHAPSVSLEVSLTIKIEIRKSKSYGRVVENNVDMWPIFL